MKRLNFPRWLPLWLGDFVLLAAIWGASFLFMQLGTREFGPLPTAGLRVMIGALFLYPFVVLRGDHAQLRKHWKITFAVGILNSAIPFACFSFALLTISTGLSAILNATVPMFGALVAWLWLKDRPTRLRSLGLGIGFLGVAMLAWDKVSWHSAAGSLSPVWAILACLLACLCYGISASIAKRKMTGIPSMVAATGSLLGASAALLPLTAAYWPATIPGARAWLAVLVLGVLCSGLAYTVYFRLIARAGPARALTVTFAIPVFAVFYGVVLLGESISPWMIVCAAIIIAGTTLSSGLLTFKK